MKFPFVFYLIFCLIFQELKAQRNDNTWYLGYPGNGEIFGPSKVTFDDGSFYIKKDTSFYRGIDDSNNTIISDNDGKYEASFNGFWINDSSGKLMSNGDSIWYETLPYLYGYSDDDIPQGGMFLPWPNHPDSILLFYTSQGNAAWPASVDLASLNLFFATVGKSANNGKGAVLEKRHTVLNDTIQYGRLSAVQHANGRDWWILINERNSNRFYRLLLDPYGVHKLDSQIVSLPVIDGLGQSAFSPDGNFYAIKNSVGANIGNFVDIFSFDRCSGYLSNQFQIHKDGSSVGGLAFSPNSRFLYVSFLTEIYQYDLNSNNLDSSKVVVGVYEPPSSGLPTTFFTMQLAPDNKIYMCATNAIRYLHVINNPDKYGLDCQFQQDGVLLPTKNYSSVSYSPYFRLGPLDNTPCDTLGMNNLPVAWYRYEQDTLDFLKVNFFDLSYYEPTTWSWDFGDGFTVDDERYPVHQFDSAGIYQVCLTVSNPNASNTHCKTIYLGVSATENPVLQKQIEISPNPFNTHLDVALNLNLHLPIFRLFDQTGRIVLEKRIAFGISEIETDMLPPGIYFWEVRSPTEMLKSGKLVKIKN
ncbi:MAG: PKD domain-containing protein [Saprospiraceae bacterium]|nr:PKD domain-containing protein [Saprospiraceae bacterium]